MKIPKIVLLRFLSAPSLSDLSTATDGQESHVAPLLLFQSQVLFCRLPHNSDESSLRSKVLSIPRAPGHKQMSSHLPTSSLVCQHWRESAVSVASPKNLEGLERWRLMDKLGGAKHGSAVCLRAWSVPESIVRLPTHMHSWPCFDKILSAQCGWCDGTGSGLRSVQPGAKPQACIYHRERLKFQISTVNFKVPLIRIHKFINIYSTVL